MTTMLFSWRRCFIVFLNAILIVSANYLAFWLRFDGKIPVEANGLFIQWLPWLLSIRGLAFIPFRLYEGLWRYSGIWDLKNIIFGVLSSTIVFYVLIQWVFGLSSYPRSVFITDSLLLICSMGGVRLTRRFYRSLARATGKKRVLIYGAGDTGETIVRDIKNNADRYDYLPIGFVDDDPMKIGRRIHGVPVLGVQHNLPRILTKEKPQELLISIPRLEPAKYRELIKLLRPFKIAVKTIGGLNSNGHGDLRVSQMRDVALEDLLERVPAGFDFEPIKKLIKGKRVLVTGAGGSIGSELCRQISRYRPEDLVLLDKAESALFTIDMEIGRKLPGNATGGGSYRHQACKTLGRALHRHAPQIVFHAAAYKHVPMMELHPDEAMLNNVTGTRRMCDASIAHHVETFIIISTDKAVNPTNVMGATKRIGEMYIQSLACASANGRPNSQRSVW